MKILLPFTFFSFVVLGIGPWFVYPGLTGQPMGHFQMVVLVWCQAIFFIPLVIILAFIGLRKFRHHKKSNGEEYAE